MLRLFDAWSRTVIRRPVAVLLLVLAVTGVLGALNTQMVSDDGVAVDNELSGALDVLDDAFGDRQSVVQIVVQATDGADVRSASALELTLALRERIVTGAVADTLIEGGQQPAVASYLGGAETAVREQGLDPSSMDDREVVQLQERALEEQPPGIAGLSEQLLAESDPPAAGLLLVFQDTQGLDEDARLAQQRALVEVVDEVDAPDGLTADPISFGLLLDDSDIGAEVGRLFGTALLLILLVLSLVFWLPRQGAGRGPLVRRTAADVGLTLLVIVLSVVWMQGVGVVLGPDYAGLIGYFSPQTQIVPILIVGLGVDFAIHLLARYRTETAAHGDPAAGLTRASRTIGLTLLLCTAATAIGFLTNLTSPVEFLATLGVLAAVGITAAFLLTLSILPAARLLLDRRARQRGRLPTGPMGAQREARLPRAIGRTSWLAETAPLPTLTAALLLVVLGGYGFTQLDSRFELTDFVPRDEPMLATFETLEAEFDGGFDESTQVLLTGSVATPAAHDRHVAAIERAAGVDDVETVAGQPDGTTLVSVLRQALGRDGLAAQLASAGLRDDLSVADDTDVEALYRLLLDQLPAAGEVLTEEDGTWLARTELRTSAGQDGAAALAAGLEDAFEPLTEAGTTPVVTSQQILQARIGEDIEDSQILSLLVALSAAMALLSLHYGVSARRPLLGVLTVLPVGLILALTFGTMALTGIPLNPVTATLAALSIGIGVPFTIHVTSRFLEERRSLPTMAGAMRETLTQTGGALVGSALTTAIGFGVLVTSTLLPFEQLGYVIVYAIGFSVVASILVLPSLLALWDRADRSRHGSPHAR